MEKITWEEAMDWYQGLGSFREMVRNAVCMRLARSGSDCGSSDINHGVYALYGRYKSYCAASGDDNIFSFLLDDMADIND